MRNATSSTQAMVFTRDRSMGTSSWSSGKGRSRTDAGTHLAGGAHLPVGGAPGVAASVAHGWRWARPGRTRSDHAVQAVAGVAEPRDDVALLVQPLVHGRGHDRER